MIRRIGIMMLLMMMASPARAATVTWVTTEPTTGTEAVGYEWEFKLLDGEWTHLGRTDEPSVLFEQLANETYQMRVRAFDEDGHLGPWAVSVEDVYGAPGACGMPNREEGQSPHQR